jgi:16S rRNA (cytosine967-C5)-methyltransferase
MPDHIFYEAPQDAYDELSKAYGTEKTQQILSAMRENALLHLRVNTRQTTADQVMDALKAEGITARKGAFLDHALRLENTVQLSKTKPFQKAWIEIQDEGSQAIAALCAVQPGMQILDYCAGGGGKTLAMADMMGGKGRIVAMDNNTKRLMRGKKRYTRADIHNVELRSLEDEKHRKWLRRQKDKFDVVLIDAPCSGSGTWRRNPDLRWRGAHPDLQETLEVQRQILNKAAQYVKQGGVLVYATCSLLPQENEEQISAFLDEHSDFKVDDAYAFLPKLQNLALDQAPEIQAKSMRLNPHDHGTDGFFACRLIKAQSS